MPKGVVVGGMRYQIIYPYTFQEDTSWVGLHESNTGKIRISQFCDGIIRPPERVYETLIHELTHAVDYVYCDGILTEDEVTKISGFWLQVFLDNNLYMKMDYKLPNVVRIGGLPYKVLYPYRFREKDNVCSISAHEQLSFRIGKMNPRDGQLYSPDYVKESLIYMIMSVIVSLMRVELGTKSNNGDTKTDSDHDTYNGATLSHISQGLYQIFVDNDIEDLVKTGVKEGRIKFNELGRNDRKGKK
jgi:hypothetical protein